VDAACRPAQPLLQPYEANLDLMEVVVDIRYCHPLLPGNFLIVPRGYTTDGASIPWIFRMVIGEPFHPRFQAAALLHDYLYTYTYGTRTDADRMLYDFLRVSGEVRQAKRWLMWKGVRSPWGALSWRRNAYENDRRAHALKPALPINEIHRR
jgi:hypothetical protein